MLSFILHKRVPSTHHASYVRVRMMMRRSRRSEGMPWGEENSVPRTVHTPRFVANTTIGESVDSKALTMRHVREYRT